MFLISFIRKIQLSLWKRWLLRTANFHIGKDVTFVGIPIIDIRNGGQITIGNNVTLNSDNVGYHLSMYSPVKLFADRSGAEIFIGNGSRIHGSCIHSYKFISIGERCLVAANCQIFDCSGHHLSFSNVGERINTSGTPKPVIIEDCVWLGASSIILPGVKIGRGSVIGAGSVVTKDIPPMVLAGGNPAKVIADYSHDINSGSLS